MSEPLDGTVDDAATSKVASHGKSPRRAVEPAKLGVTMHVCCAESSADRIVCWCNSPDTGWQERAMGATLSVTFIGVTVLWVGALALLVEKLAF